MFPYDRPDGLTKYSATKTILTSETFVSKPGLNRPDRLTKHSVTETILALETIILKPDFRIYLKLQPIRPQNAKLKILTTLQERLVFSRSSEQLHNLKPSPQSSPQPEINISVISKCKRFS